MSDTEEYVTEDGRTIGGVVMEMKNITLRFGGVTAIKDITFDLTTLGNDFDSGENSFADTAAVMINCDLIISSDTSITHLAGALGCPTWVVLQKIPEWRWMLDRTDSPWYPNMTLYRQEEFGDWKYVFEIMKKDLAKLIKQVRKIK